MNACTCTDPLHDPCPYCERRIDDAESERSR